MSLFEWLGESFKPGPVGDVDASHQPLFPNEIKKGWAIFFMIIGLGVFGFFLWLVFNSGTVLWSLAFFAAYLLLSYFITPRPDSSNMGWFGGLINNPFRISDDANRLLVFFYLFLLPGKLVVFALQTFYRLIKYNL